MDWQTSALSALIVYSAVISILYIRRSRRFKYRLRKALSRNTSKYEATLQAADEARFQAAADEAMKLYERAYAGRKSKLGPDHPSTHFSLFLLNRFKQKRAKREGGSQKSVSDASSTPSGISISALSCF